MTTTTDHTDDRPVEPQATLTNLFCPKCGQSDRLRSLKSRHYSRGSLCNGVPVEVKYVRAPVAAHGVIEGPSSTEYEAWLETRPDLTARFETDTFKRTTGYEIWRNAWLKLRGLVTTGEGVAATVNDEKQIQHAATAIVNRYIGSGGDVEGRRARCAAQIKAAIRHFAAAAPVAPVGDQSVCDCHTWPTVAEMHDYAVALEGVVYGLRPAHKCRPLARAVMDVDREWWTGELLEPVPGWPKESYCLHMKTPVKDVIFLCNSGDFEQLMVLSNAVVALRSLSWLESMTEGAKLRAATTSPADTEKPQ